MVMAFHFRKLKLKLARLVELRDVQTRTSEALCAQKLLFSDSLKSWTVLLPNYITDKLKGRNGDEKLCPTTSVTPNIADVNDQPAPRTFHHHPVSSTNPMNAVMKILPVSSADSIKIMTRGIHIQGQNMSRNCDFYSKQEHQILPSDIYHLLILQHPVSTHVQFNTALENTDLQERNSSLCLCCGRTDGASGIFKYAEGVPEGGTTQKKNQPSKDKPSLQQLLDIQKKLEELVLNMLKNQHDYKLLHKNVVLENNLFNENKRSVGVTAYAMELMKLRFRIHIQYPSTVMSIVNVHIMEQEGIVRIHWQLKGISQIQLLKVWKIRKEQDWEFLEAFSYFHIGGDGTVHKHRMDRTIPQTKSEPSKAAEKLKELLNPT